MFKWPVFFLLFGCFCVSNPVWSQDSTQLLPLLTIRSARLEQTGFKRWQADSLPVLMPVSGAQRLSWESPLSVRITAPGTLATVSARGMGPTHTPVFWNGINLQSPMNGVVDVSLLPVWPEDQLELRSGGQSAALGSGAMGGAVLLDHPWQSKPGFSGNAGVQVGSFDQKNYQGKLAYQRNNWQISLRGNHQKATNDFPFRNTVQIGRPLVRQQNNALEKSDFQQFFQFQRHPKHTFRALFWQQYAFRAIPQPITASPKESWQKDRARRSILSWIYQPAPKTQIQTKIAWLDEWIAFRLSGDTDTSYAQTLLYNSELTQYLSEALTIKIGVQALQQWARADGYADSAKLYQQIRLAGFALAEWRVGTGKLSALVRQEWAQNQQAPFTWSLGGVFSLGPHTEIAFHGSRNFNMPTFNDRFWMVYGQTDLASERGYSTDVNWKNHWRYFSAEITAFHILIDDWILWQPGDDGVFRPGNLKKVASRGLELAFTSPFKLKNVYFRAKASYQLNRTTNVAVYNNATNSLEQQLLYVPIHGGAALFQAQYRRWMLSYTHQYTGKRYIQSDNSSALPAFQLGTFYTAWQVGTSKKTRLAFDFRIENCWNKAYSFLAYQPMPGRSFQGGLRFAW